MVLRLVYIKAGFRMGYKASDGTSELLLNSAFFDMLLLAMASTVN